MIATYFGDADARVSVCGKEVIIDDRHLADAVSEEAAQVIGMALLYFGARSSDIPSAELTKIKGFFA